MPPKRTEKVRLCIYRTKFSQKKKTVEFGNSDSIVSVWMFQYSSANSVQLASAFKFSFGGKVFTPFTIGKHQLNINNEVLFYWLNLFSIHRTVITLL